MIVYLSKVDMTLSALLRQCEQEVNAKPESRRLVSVFRSGYGDYIAVLEFDQ